MSLLLPYTSNIGETNPKKRPPSSSPTPTPNKKDPERDRGHQRGVPDAPKQGNTSGDRKIGTYECPLHANTHAFFFCRGKRKWPLSPFYGHKSSAHRWCNTFQGVNNRTTTLKRSRHTIRCLSTGRGGKSQLNKKAPLPKPSWTGKKVQKSAKSSPTMVSMAVLPLYSLLVCKSYAPPYRGAD